MAIDFENIYTPASPPANVDRVTAEWVHREFRRLHDTLAEKVGMHGEDGAWEDNTADLATGRSVGSGAVSYGQINSGYYAPEMATGTPTRIVQVAFHVKHDVKRGSKIYPHVHWTTNGSNSGDVTWTLKYQVAKGYDQDNFPTQTTITIDQTVAPAAAWRHFIAEGTNESTQTIDMPEVDSLILMTVQLTANTISTDTIYGLYVDLHYQKERTGTLNRNGPDFYTR